jgi:hypothetical protein
MASERSDLVFDPVDPGPADELPADDQQRPLRVAPRRALVQ